MIGQDAVNTAQAFLDGVGYDGVVLTKLDGDARGGAALSIRSITGRPIMFASAGEKLTDFDLFHPDRMASRILDMGDMLTLIEQAEKAFDADQAAKAAAKLTGEGGDFTLDDFLQQMQAIRKMGSLSKIMGMLPGMGQFRDQLANFDEREIDRIQAIIQSMTPGERANPKVIDGSRRSRIAKGSGVHVSEVNLLVERFFEARKMMQSLAKGGNVPGMPGMPGMGKRGKGKQPAKKAKAKRGSGNPAKRAQEEKAAAEKPAAAPDANPFGLPNGPARLRPERLPAAARGGQVPEVSRPVGDLCAPPARRALMGSVLVVDGANVVGSRPDGWWRDRGGSCAPAARAARRRGHPARRGRARPRGSGQGRRTRRPGRPPAHGPCDAATATTRSWPRRGVPRSEGHDVEVVTADRILQLRVAAVGGTTLPPSWLLDRI